MREIRATSLLKIMSDKPKSRTLYRREQRTAKRTRSDEARANARKERRESTGTVARVLTRDERAKRRTFTAQQRAERRAQRDASRKERGGKASNEGLYDGNSAANRARGRADNRAQTDRRNQAGRTNGRDEGLYRGRSEADKARDNAARKAAADKQRQAARRADGGLHSSAAAKDRPNTAAKTVQREGLYDQNSPANRARGRADQRAATDKQSQAKRDVTSPAYKAEQAKKRQEAEAKRKQAEAKARELEQKAKAARARVDQLKGKDKRAARAEAERLEAEAKAAQQAAKEAGREQHQASDPQQDHLYNGGGESDQAHNRSREKREARQDHLYGRDPAAAAREDAARAVYRRQDHLYSGPVSAPPVVRNSSASMHRTCTAQAWSKTETTLALLA